MADRDLGRRRGIPIQYGAGDILASGDQPTPALYPMRRQSFSGGFVRTAAACSGGKQAIF